MPSGERLQVANEDSRQQMSWSKAKEVCANLGNGWRLPTKEELVTMYKQLHLKGRGNFPSPDRWYYSSEISDDQTNAWYIWFGSGEFSYGTYAYVRAVRALD